MPRLERPTDGILRIFDPEYVDQDPSKDAFYAEIRQTVGSIVGENVVVENLTKAEKGELRRQFLGVRIKLTAEGEIVHE